MEIVIFYTLVSASVLIGGGLMVFGVYGFVKQETYLLDKRIFDPCKIYGKLARVYSLFYFLGGIIWFGYAVFRIYIRYK